MKNLFTSAILCIATALVSFAQYPVIKGVDVRVKFDEKIRTWDGFGFNYVETAQTPDYSEFPQEYGGFSLLDENEKTEIIDMIFGEDGLKVGLVKMFYDPFHQTEPNGPFDHETTTQNIREFVRKGLEKTRSRGGDLNIITTLYGPPAYMTLQKKIRGRDLDPMHKEDLANYLVNWVSFLRDKEGFPVNYVSLHNEGEDWGRWPWDGKDPNIGHGHDYNLYFTPELVNEMMIITRKKLDEAGLSNVGVTPGEMTNWYRFSYWGYADAIAQNPEAIKAIGLITSHGFFSGSYDNRWFGDHNCMGTEMIREKKPGLHAWVTSTSWSKMDAKNIKEMHDNIYSSRVNGIIPWAGIQRPVQWVGGDPNPGSAFTVNEDGSYEVRRGYYFYKQITRAGQPGMDVCRTLSNETELPVIAFGRGNSTSPDAFVVTNMSGRWEKPAVIKITGSNATEFKAYRTSEDEKEKYTDVGTFNVTNGEIFYVAPPATVTTFFANNNQARRDRPRREIKWVNPNIADMPGLSHHILDSKSLGHEVGYSVWTPPQYSEKSKKSFPVIYFLHGAGGNESADAGGFSGWAAKAIEKGTLPSAICVFPNGGLSGYRGEVEKMIIEELIPTIDKDYRTIAKQESRALAGFSMGGAGSVYLSIMYPELFCAAGSMGGGIGGRRMNAESQNQIEQAIDKALPVWKKNGYGFFLVNGDNDRPDAFKSFSEKLNQNGIDNKVIVLPDTKHNLGLYYQRSVEQLLEYLGKYIKD